MNPPCWLQALLAARCDPNPSSWDAWGLMTAAVGGRESKGSYNSRYTQKTCPRFLGHILELQFS